MRNEICRRVVSDFFALIFSLTVEYTNPVLGMHHSTPLLSSSTKCRHARVSFIIFPGGGVVLVVLFMSLVINKL